MAKYGRLEIEIKKELVSRGEPAWEIVIWHMFPTIDGKGEHGNGSVVVPRFEHRMTAKWVAERMHDAYIMDGWDVSWKKRERRQ